MDYNDIKLKDKGEYNYDKDRRSNKVQNSKEDQTLISADDKYRAKTKILEEVNYKEPTKKEKETIENEEKSEEEAKEKEESIIDKYMFILYALIYIVLVYSVVNISLDYNCYTSLKSIFGFNDIETSTKISPFEIVSDIMTKINKISSLNYILQVNFI
jgi:hypothetical protein